MISDPTSIQFILYHDLSLPLFIHCAVSTVYCHYYMCGPRLPLLRELVSYIFYSCIVHKITVLANHRYRYSELIFRAALIFCNAREDETQLVPFPMPISNVCAWQTTFYINSFE